MSARATRRSERGRVLDTPWLVPAPPLTARESRWAAALLGDEVALRRWLRRRRMPAEVARGGGESTCVANVYPVVAIAVLSCNDRRAALRCLDGIARLTYRPGAFSVVLVENSTDPAQRLDAGAIRARGYGFDVTLLRPDRNVGFAAGVNLSARHAFGRGGADHLLLLNDDAVIPAASRDLLQELVALSGLLPDVAAVGPKIHFARHSGGPDVVASPGADFVDLPPGVGHRDPGLHGVVESDFVVGVCMLIPRRAWQTVGEFDERYFAYYEETEWCYRARRLGLRVYCQRDLLLRHGDEAVERRKRHRDPACTRLMARNQVLLARCHPWFDEVVAARLTRKYRQLLALGEAEGARGMVEGIALAQRECFPTRRSRRTSLATVAARRAARGVRRPAILFSMGRLNRRKGVDVLVRLAAQCPAGFEVHIRGVSAFDLQDPDDAAYLGRLVEVLRTSGALRRNRAAVFGGFDTREREAFLRQYARRDAVLVHPARPEGFGLVLLEAMAHGIPAVADERGGLARALRGQVPSLVDLVDFGRAGWEAPLWRRLRRAFVDRRALARRRRRLRVWVAAQRSLAQMATAYRRRLLATCAERGLRSREVVLLSGGTLYRVGGAGEWLASVAPRLRGRHGLRVALLSLPGRSGEPVARYGDALRGLPWREVAIRAHEAAATPPSDAVRECFRDLVRLFATETPPSAPRYTRTLGRFQRRIGGRAYWGMWNGARESLVACYVEARPALSRSAARRGLALLLHGYLVENLLAGPIAAGACVYAVDPATGLPAAVHRERGVCGAYVLGLHAFTDLFYDGVVDGWQDLRRAERSHFKRVVGDLLAYSVMRADSVICVSPALEEHLRQRFAGYPLPPIETIANTLLAR